MLELFYKLFYRFIHLILEQTKFYWNECWFFRLDKDMIAWIHLFFNSCNDLYVEYIYTY